MQQFAGKKALVVGGSGGIGGEISRRLAERGAELCIHWGRDGQKCAALAESLRAGYKSRVNTVQFDFSAQDFASLRSSSLLKQAESADILCVCYGPFVQKPLHGTQFADWTQCALLDYALPGVLVSAALPHMMERHWGRILLFGGTGTAHRSEFVTNAAYAGAKAAVGVLVQSTACAYAGYGITCNAVLPGFTKTEYSAAQEQSLAAKMPLGTMVAAGSVADSALFLLSNPDINGELLRVDRGWSPVFAAGAACSK